MNLDKDFVSNEISINGQVAYEVKAFHPVRTRVIKDGKMFVVGKMFDGEWKYAYSKPFMMKREALKAAKFILAMEIKELSKEPKPRTEEPLMVTSRSQAFEILGLPETASLDEIRSSYKRMALHLHPDQKGSKYLMVLLNQSRDLLLKK